MKGSKSEFYYIRESAIQSIIADIFSFGIFFIFLTVNYKLWEGETIVTVFLCILWLLVLTGKFSKSMKVFYKKEDLIKYLQEEEV
jgi:cell division protein FtsW (lipid II flippase)